MIDGDRQEGSSWAVPFSYTYPRPAVTCDAVVFTIHADDLAVLLIKRKSDPFKGQWALPGGFVNENESLDRAAARELSEETGLSGTKLEQLGAFGDPGRDPRGHTVTVAYLTFLVAEAKITPSDDAAEAEWHPFRRLELDDAPLPAGRRARARSKTAATTKLAFDHGKIIASAYDRLLQYLDNPLRARAFDLVPSRFTLAQLHHFYEVITGRAWPERAFKKRLLDQNLVLPATPEPARGQLYRWNRTRSK